MGYTKQEQAANRAKWVEALESGRYEQTEYALKKGDRFCATGVACDISGLGEWVESPNRVDVFSYVVVGGERIDGLDVGYNTMPKTVQDWLGVYGNGELKRPYERVVATTRGEDVELLYWIYEVNDSGVDFGEIAEMVKRGDLKERGEMWG